MKNCSKDKNINDKENNIEKNCCEENNACSCENKNDECSCKNNDVECDIDNESHTTCDCEENCDCDDECGCNCGENCNCENGCDCNDEKCCDETTTSEDKDIHDESSTNENVINDLKKQIDFSNEKISNLNLEIIKLKQQIFNSQEEYKKSLERKAIEANEKVAEKRKELEEKLKVEVENKKFKIFSNDMQQLLATIDQFEAVVNSPCDDPAIQGYVSGFRMLSTLFEQSLSNMGISKIVVSQGDKFDEKFMTIIDTIVDDNVEEGTIIRVISQAYEYNEKIIKHATVVVAKKK